MQYFYWSSWGNPMVYKKNGVNLGAPVRLFQLHTVDSDFSIGEDADGYEVLLANAAIDLFVSGGTNRVAEFFGTIPKPPHK